MNRENIVVLPDEEWEALKDDGELYGDEVFIEDEDGGRMVECYRVYPESFVSKMEEDDGSE